MQSEKKIKFLDRLSLLRETQFGAFLPVLFALTAIWGYFGLILPIHDLISGEAENFRAIFLSPRNIYNLFMQSAVIAALAVGITVVLLLGEIDLSAAKLLVKEAENTIGVPKKLQLTAAKAKAFSTKVCQKHFPILLHKMGAEGFQNDYPFSKYIAAVQMASLMDGSNEMLLERISRES